MAPAFLDIIARSLSEDVETTASSLRIQWQTPSDVFSVLLILGGDIVGKALAQLVGNGLAPVAFSFGWVGYSVSALVSVVGENKLMPLSPDCGCKIINGKSGYVVPNTSWVLGRVVRDYHKWMHPTTAQKLNQVMDEKWKELKTQHFNATKPRRSGLVIAIYKPDPDNTTGEPQRDWLYWSGAFTTMVQLGLATIPCVLAGDWGILMITACGTCLALLTGTLPQWRKEKLACRRRSNDAYLLTKGNGSQHVIAILNNGYGLNLEDLANGQNNYHNPADGFTRVAMSVLCMLWILLLITASGLKTGTWFLLGVGAVGSLQNICVAGSARHPSSFGIHLKFVTVFGRTKVMKTLMDVEAAYPGLGSSMLVEFFPGGLREDEQLFWREAKLKRS